MECPRCHIEVSDTSVRCPACLADLPPAATLLHERGDVEVLDGKWALEKKLGQGGMGTVYLAHDVELDRRVAIKMMGLAHADDAEVVARFEREARIMAKLDHPNVVPVYAVGRRDGLPYIVMKYLEGVSLQDYLKARGRLPLGEVLSVTQQACEGLQFIHDRGVVHRDIKPANIFLAPNGHVTLLDLGVAHDAHHSMTRSGVIVGTPRYMSPEQVLGKRVDFHADLYALATVVFEMLTGAPVFDHDSDYSIMRAHIDEPPPAPSSLADVPEALTPVLNQALAKNPADRFPSALALAEALAEALGPEVKPVRPQPVPDAPSWAKGPTPRPSMATPRTPPPEDSQKRVGTVHRPAAVPTRVAPKDPTTPPPTRLDAPSSPAHAAGSLGPVPEAQPPRASSKPSTNEISAVRGPRRALWGAGALGVAAVIALLITRPWAGAPVAAPSPAVTPASAATAPSDAPPVEPGAVAPPGTKSSLANPSVASPSVPEPTRAVSSLAKSSAAKSSAAKSSVANPSAGNSSAVNPSAASPPAAKPSDAKSSDAKSSDASPSVAKSSAAKSSAAKSSATSPSATNGPVAKSSTTAVPAAPTETVDSSAAGAASPARAKAPANDAELRLVVTAGGKLSWAWVDVDGLRQGTAPLTVRLAPGKHTLVFHRDGYESETRTIELVAGETHKLAVELSTSARVW